MATYRKMLKDKNGDNIIPVTRELAGPSLIGIMVQKAVDGSEISAGTSFNWSFQQVGSKSVDYEYDPYDLIVSQSGAVYYTHKSGVKFIEAEVTMTGLGYGIWQHENKNGNPLNGAVVMNNKTEPLMTAGGAGDKYGGCILHVWYDVSGMNVGDSFYINPEMTAYNTGFRPSYGGTKSVLTIKIYGQ